MSRRTKSPSGVIDAPLDVAAQAKAREEGRPSVRDGRLKTYEPGANVGRFLELLGRRVSRPLAVSLTACVHCGRCAESCHYFLARPDDPTMTPVWKADQIRKIFKRHVDWTGRVAPWWAKAGTPDGDEDLNRLKNVVFGACSACRRCTFNCPMGVDTALLVRFTRGLLTELGIVPEGVFNVSRDQWETGNQMAVTETDFLETIEWMRDDLRAELGPGADIPVDRPDCDILYTINPREIKFDPRSIAHAARIFHAAGASWTLPKWGWDQTNFGLFSGDDALGAYVSRNLYEAAERLRARRIVISECGHGYRSTRWEGYTWSGYDQKLPTESIVAVLRRYLEEGRIVVDPGRNLEPVTFHDSCNIARSGDLVEEPRQVLRRVCADFREMHPNRQENFCCTGGGGLLAMAEYRPLRLEAGKVKAEQLKATEAALVCTMCHNCIDGLGDVIKHYHLPMRVVQVLELVSRALVLPAGS
ncbi:MAG TPA: (Fe-S)-binding protein [Candidatus Aminicenantes bacterium]|nr:(Fe-S)-binding protein [Candidatus Aminicenantes bacterium]HRY65127.1 (Fe-S)-binding protein [Candidatus Aminicenantes bacterium]HRZ72405.1 (Fe-S)-binding protein [Candidatus Aminicenantes bacterium]